MLSRHVDTDDLLQRAADHPHQAILKAAGGGNSSASHTNIHAGRYQTEGIVSSDAAALTLITVN